MEAIFLLCGAGGPQLKRNPLGGAAVSQAPQVHYMGLWKEDKLLFISLVFAAGLLVWSLFEAADDYSILGWHSLLLPAAAVYLLLRLSLLARRRLPTLGESLTTEEANRMKGAFRSESKAEFDELVAEEGPKLLAHRASLWQEAPTSLKAARRLQQDIQTELETMNDIIESAAKHRPDDKEELAGLLSYRKEVEDELQRATHLVRHLRG